MRTTYCLLFRYFQETADFWAEIDTDADGTVTKAEFMRMLATDDGGGGDGGSGGDGDDDNSDDDPRNRPGTS